MEVGDRVTYYRHEASDALSTTTDRLAFVTQVVDDNCLDVVIIPPGGPIEFKRVCRYDPEDLGQPVGLDYWRPHGEDPPDFSRARFSTDPEWIALGQKHQQEWDKTPPEGRPALRDKHRQEYNNLFDKLEKRDGPLKEPKK